MKKYQSLYLKINIDKRIKKEYNLEEKRDILRRIIKLILKERISIENQERLLKKLKKEGNDMILEVIRKENEKQRKEGRKEGRKQGIQEITKNLLKLGINIEDIKKATGLSQKELQNLAKNNN